MPTIIKNIALIEAGGESLVSAKRANEIIERLNAITSAILAPNVNVGNFQTTGSQFILDLSLFDSRLKAVEDELGTGTGSNNSITNRVSNIENRLENVTINGSGSCSGNNISITVNINI